MMRTTVACLALMLVAGCTKDGDEINTDDVATLSQPLQDFQYVVVLKPSMARRARTWRDGRAERIYVDRHIVWRFHRYAVEHGVDTQ